MASPASQTGNSSQAGQSGNQGNRSGRQRALWASQGNSTASQIDSDWLPREVTQQLTPLIDSLKSLPQKTLTLSGSLTFPANL